MQRLLQRLRHLRVSMPIQVVHFLLCVVVGCAIAGTTLIKIRRIGMASALCDAAQAGDVTLIKYMLQRGADPNELNAMGYARRGGHQAAIELLERAGAKEKPSAWTP